MSQHDSLSSLRNELTQALGFDRLEALGRGPSRGKFRAWRRDRSYLLSLCDDAGAPAALDKELGLSALLLGGAVPLAGIIESGVVKIDSVKVHYVVKEFLTGCDYAQLFEAYQGLSTDQVRTLLFDLGAALGRIHNIAVPEAGDLAFGPEPGFKVSRSEPTSWFMYLSKVIAWRKKSLQALPGKQRMGGLTPTVLLNRWSQYLEFLKRFAPDLVSVSPRLIHNDAIPGNFMASRDEKSGVWHLAAVLDIDTMIGGDPEFDLVSLENWFEFAPCKTLVVDQRRHLVEGYASTAPSYSGALRFRRLYSAFRCLNYLTFLLALYPGDAESPPKVESVELNLQLTSQLIQGGAALELF
jgi:aminoglycoside phosphotransferase (APT) family kinase protein